MEVSFSSSSVGIEVLLTEVAKACQMNEQEVQNQLAILRRHRFVSEVLQDEWGNPTVIIYDLEPGWRIWSDLLEYSQQTRIPLDRLLVEIRFDLLD
jgi:glycyl-tRNA synthetase alpha subunit